jgi:hypothetical protein
MELTAECAITQNGGEEHDDPGGDDETAVPHAGRSETGKETGGRNTARKVHRHKCRHVSTHLPEATYTREG